MPDFFAMPAVRIGLGLLVVCVLVAAGFYLVSIFRDYADQDQESTPEALANLLEMHRKGDISDEEFRNIEAKTRHPSLQTGTEDKSTSPDDTSVSTRP